MMYWYHGCTGKEMQRSPNVQNQADKPRPVHEFHIQIDRVHYEVDQATTTGAHLRNVPPSPIGAERDLFAVRPGEPDLKIGDGDAAEIRDGKRFFTAPGQITPG